MVSTRDGVGVVGRRRSDTCPMGDCDASIPPGLPIVIKERLGKTEKLT